MVREGGKSSSHTKRKNVESSAVEVNYRTQLTAIVGTVRLFLGQGWPFEGRNEFERSWTGGQNFLELLKLKCEHNENVKNAFESNGLENDPLTSPAIRKEIVEACTAETVKCIVNEIGDKLFSLSVGGTQDVDCEHMTVVLRFVNDSGEVIERFLGVLHVSDTSTQSFKDAIDILFSESGLSLSRVRGQSYDGLSNMHREFNKLQTRILKENKHAYYFHCFAQDLQLIVADVWAEKLYMFFPSLFKIVNVVGASLKMSDALQKLQHEEAVKQIQKAEISTENDKNQEMSPTQSGNTHWGSHHETLIRLFDMWETVENVLETIEHYGRYSDDRSNAANSLDAMFTFEFVFVAKFMMTILGITSDLSLILQGNPKEIDQRIKVVKKNLQAYRKDGWGELLEEVTKFCSAQEIPNPNMEDILSSNVERRLYGESMTKLHLFYVDTFIEVIDHIAEELDNRFSELNTELLMCIMCLDPSNAFANFNHERLLHLAELYSEDFSSSELVELDHQLKTYIPCVKSDEAFLGLPDIGALAKKMAEKQYHIRFHLVYRVIELALLLPIVKANVERSFSEMKSFETDLREDMGDEFFFGCMVCYVEKRTFVSIENEVILQHFQNMKSREFRLSPISSSNIE